jgi:hypothetical protein
MDYQLEYQHAGTYWLKHELAECLVLFLHPPKTPKLPDLPDLPIQLACQGIVDEEDHDIREDKTVKMKRRLK